MSFSRTLIFMLWLTGAALATSAHHCSAQTIAILPVEDLSQGANGLNFAMTQTLSETLTEKGFTVSRQEDIVAFMVKNRVRWLGSLSSPYIRRLQDQLQVKYLLLGSISQQRTTPPFALNLNLQLIRTKDCQIIWSTTAEHSDVNRVSLLNLSGQLALEQIEQQVARNALSTIPITPQEQHPLERQAHIDSVQLNPKIVQPGGTVRCQIRLSNNNTSASKTAISIYIGEHLVDAHYDSQTKVYKASWLSGRENKQHTVTAIISSAGYTSREILIGSYRVDGLSPKLTLRIKGQEVDGPVILQEQVKIMPRLQTPEPITRWNLTVRDETGTTIVNETGHKRLPPQFSWWGQGQHGNQVQDGLYSIELSIWDRAGNLASSQESIRVFRKKPEISLAMEKQPNSLAVALNYSGEIPLAYWRLQIRDRDGMIIAERSGSEDTKKILLPLKMAGNKNISYRLYAQDMLGNHVQQEVTPTIKGRKKNQNKDDAEDEGDFLASAQGTKKIVEDVWEEDF